MYNYINILKEYDWAKIRRVSDMQGDDYDSIDILIRRIIKSNIQILEIGSSLGSSCALFALYAKEYKGKVYSVDKYSSDCLGNPGNYLPNKNAFHTNINNLGLADFVEQLHMASNEAVKLFEDETFDLIFIDGSHLYLDIKEDLEIWYPKVKKEGIFCGHDCEKYLKDIKDMNDYVPEKEFMKTDYIKGIHPGVVQAVGEKFENAKILGHRIWWVKK